MFDIKGYKQCQQCGQIFYMTDRRQKYCCLHCYQLASQKTQIERNKKYLSDNQNRKKHLIRLKTNYLCKKGKIEKQNCCKCGCSQNIEKHHPYYSDSCVSVVIWLCKHCHEQLHKELSR